LRRARGWLGFAAGLLGLTLTWGCASSPRLITKRVDGHLVVTRPIPPQAYEHVTRALLFEEDGRIQEAADEIGRALPFDDDAPELWSHLAELDTRLGHLDEAAESLQRAETLGPTVEGALAAAFLAEARHDETAEAAALVSAVARADADGGPQHLEDAHLADAEWRLGALDTNGAFATLQALVQRLPSSARGRRQLAAVAWAAGRPTEAESALTSLLEEDPNDLDARLLLATLLAATDRPSEAKQAFGEGLSRSEESVEIAEIYLKWLMDRGDVAEARRLADDLVVSDPSSDEAAERTSRIERAVKRFDLARAAAETARAHGATTSAMTFLAAEAEADAGHHRAAATAFLQIAKDAPQAFSARLRAADALRAEHDDAGARQALDEAAALLGREAAETEAGTETADRDAKLVQLTVARSQVAESAGDAAQATHLLDDALKKTPDEARLVLAWAAVQERSGHWEKALQAAERVLAREKRSVEALNFSGFVAADHHHDLPRALGRLTAAAALDPGNGAILDSLGWAALALGDLGKAAPFLRQAARLEPGDPEILSHLAELESRLGSKPRALDTLKRALGLAPEPRVKRALEARLRELEGSPSLPARDPR